jgi:hypothetical protein
MRLPLAMSEYEAAHLQFKVSWVGSEISLFADVADHDDRVSHHMTPPILRSFDRQTSARRICTKGS